jgi:phosphoribosylformimino-5-aminoimidazole carboxamide ribotide isomerase
LHSLYLADLDAIGGQPPCFALFEEIVSLGIHLLVDAGIRDVDTAAPLLDLDKSSSTLVVGLETVRGPRELAEIVVRAGADRVIFSLDLFDGRPRTAAPIAWASDDPRDLAREAIEQGVRTMILLDLSRVGTGRGLGTETLVASVRREHRGVRIILGGGIATTDEVMVLRNAGAAGVLVGSAIHDGRIGAADLARL